MSDFESGAFNRALPTLRLSILSQETTFASRIALGHRPIYSEASSRAQHPPRCGVKNILPTAEWTPDLKLWLHEQATEAGFVTVGIAKVDAIDSASAANDVDAERFAAWVEAGRAGE